MSSTFLPRLVQLLLATWIAVASATAAHGGTILDPTLQSLNGHLAGLNTSDPAQVERLISVWGHPIRLPGDLQQHGRLHDRSPHPRALGELRELFARQVKCGSGTCNSGSCCVKTKEGKDGCCSGRCCTTGCCDADQSCGDGVCINPIKYVTSTTTREIGSTTTLTTSVSGTTTYWSTVKSVSIVRTTVSNIATATHWETKIVTVTETPGSPTASAIKRGAHEDRAPPMTAIDLRRAQPESEDTEPMREHIYYIRHGSHLDPLASALSKRGLSILRRTTVTSTIWSTNTNTKWSTSMSTATNWRVLTSMTTSIETTTSTSYLNAATTVTSTRTSTTRILAGTTPTDLPVTITPEPDDSSNNDSPKPIAAIVGGTVGGVAGIALLGAIIFIVKRRRHWADQDAAAAADPNAAGRASTLGLPVGNPDRGANGRGAVESWQEPKPPFATVGTTGAPSFMSGPTMTSAGSHVDLQHPYAPYSDHGGSPDPRALSGQWYPPAAVGHSTPVHHEMGATPAPGLAQPVQGTAQPVPVPMQQPIYDQYGNTVSHVDVATALAQRMYAQDHQNLSGQWYPPQQQQASEMGGGQMAGELPAQGQGQSQAVEQGHVQTGQHHGYSQVQQAAPEDGQQYGQQHGQGHAQGYGQGGHRY